MKKTWIILLILIVLVTATILAVSANEDAQPTEPSVETGEKKGDFLEPELPPYEEQRSEGYPSLTNAEFDALTVEQQEALRALHQKNLSSVGKFHRQEKQILGTLSENDVRITKDKAMEIISEYDGIETIEHVFVRYVCPDYSGGSGILRFEFWLDETRTQYIEICFNEVVHVITDGEGNTISTEILYSPSATE